MDLDVDPVEHDALCEKIINDVHAVFLKDTDLSSFEIIPTLLNRNKSPVVHVDHNLGLESWCAKHVYDHAHKTLIALKRQNQQRYLHQSDTLIKYLNVALLINPDVSTFWNIRRQMVQTNRLKITEEFQFSAIILTKKPKSNEAFAYRRWLFSFQSSESIDWTYEISICERSADRSSSNYHAWSHRLWVLQNAQFLMRSELMMSEKFVRKHISDYSSYHYRQALIKRAYAIGFYLEDDLAHLKALIVSYMRLNVHTAAETFAALLPGVDRSTIGDRRISSFLYCCNLSASDMRLCDDQRSLYGDHESFEKHRRASLHFIVEHCVRLLLGEIECLDMRPPTPVQKQEFNSRLRKFDYSTNPFLHAVRLREGLLGEKHREWCNLFLGFDYTVADGGQAA